MACSVLRDILEAEGYQVASAPDGLDALELLKRLPRPSLILLDLRMPRLDGRQFRALQREDPVLAEIPVVIVAATPLSLREAQEFDAAGYFTKPYDAQVLLDMIAHHCG